MQHWKYIIVFFFYHFLFSQPNVWLLPFHLPSFLLLLGDNSLGRFCISFRIFCILSWLIWTMWKPEILHRPGNGFLTKQAVTWVDSKRAFLPLAMEVSVCSFCIELRFSVLSRTFSPDIPRSQWWCCIFQESIEHIHNIFLSSLFHLTELTEACLLYTVCLVMSLWMPWPVYQNKLSVL